MANSVRWKPVLSRNSSSGSIPVAGLEARAKPPVDHGLALAVRSFTLHQEDQFLGGEDAFQSDYRGLRAVEVHQKLVVQPLDGGMQIPKQVNIRPETVFAVARLADLFLDQFGVAREV